MTYRTPESIIRQIMAESHAPALRIPEPDRVADALKVLQANGVSATKHDDKTISIENGDVEKAYTILDNAIFHGMIQAKPLIQSSNAISVDDHTPPVEPAKEPTPPEGGHKIGEETEEPQIEAKVSNDEDKRPSLVKRTEIKTKIIDETAQQLDELGYSKLNAYVRAGREALKSDKMDGRIERRKKGLEMAKTKKVKMVSKAAFGEEVVQPIDTLLRVRTALRLVEAKGERLIATHNSECGKHCAKVYKNTEFGEHRVAFHINGKHHEPADYFAGDVHDAHATAQAEMKRMTKLNGALKEATEEDINDLLEEVEQIDELSKKLLGNYVKKATQSAAEHAKDGALRRADAGMAAARHSEFKEKGDTGSADAAASRTNMYMKMAKNNIRRSSNRVAGVAKAVNRLTKEEAEEGNRPFQIDELSANTLTNYAVKAPGKIKSEFKKGQEHQNAASAELHSSGQKSFAKYDHHMSKGGQHIEKGYVHSRALKKVGNKIAAKAMPVGVHEAEQIDELSKGTLGSYVRKAGIDMAANVGNSTFQTAKGDRKSAIKSTIKSHKRQRGIAKAVDKLVREETLSEGKKDDLAKAEKHFAKHKNVDAIHRTVVRASQNHNYVQDAMDNIYSNHQRDLKYEDWHNMKPHIEDMLKKRGLQ